MNPKNLVLSRREMVFADKYTMNNLGIPSAELMENAGLGCSKKIRQLVKAQKFLLGDKPNFALFCGSGNNGGDGFVIARYLTQWGFNCKIFLLGDEGKMSPETHANFEACRKLNIKIEKIENTRPNLENFQVIIDAIFGIGFKGEIRGFAREIILSINEAEKICFSIDIPSGIDADSGAGEMSVNANYTLTMAARKYGHFLGKGQHACGEIFVIDIGIPQEVFRKFPPRGLYLSDESVVYPKRSRFSHKGDFGRIGIIAGSAGFTGAAVLASQAAGRAGGGLITLFYPVGLEQIFEIKLTEVMTQSIDPELSNFVKCLQKMDVLLIGPGIGKAATTRKLLHFLLMFWRKPLVLDADALSIIAENHWQRYLNNPQIVCTPHIGEFARLTGYEINEVLSDPIAKIDEFIGKYSCGLLLKSATTIYADQENLIFDDSGNDGLATGGSGDVLAGILVSFLGQKLKKEQAAPAASYLLGKTAERLANYRKPASIIPSDIVGEIFKY